MSEENQSHSFPCITATPKKKRAERYHTDALRYRGVVYKEID